MIHFVKNIFPKINGTLGCRLFIVGMNQLNSVKGLRSDWVTVTGFVEDLREYYERCRVFVVPTRFAAGIPLKLLEAMSHGIPAVVTPLIAEELGLSEGEGLLIGKDDADFARKVTELYRNETLWHDIQEKALEYVRLNCDREKMKLHLDRIIKGETSPSPLPSPLRGEG
jgi:glycosyltransferase involved in cell wall biosynthesis